MADTLTDDELQKQLQAYGLEKVGPITDSTRSIYIKKLNHLRAADRKGNKGSARAQRGRKLAAFSSDESDVDESSGQQPETRVNNRRRSGRTSTRPATSTPSRTTLRRSSRGRPDVSSTTNGTQETLSVKSNSNTVIGNSYNTPRYSAPFEFDSSDGNEQDEDDIDTKPNTPEMVSRSINTSSFLDQSYFDRTLNDTQLSRRSVGREHNSRPNSSFMSPVTSVHHYSSRGNHLTPGGQSLDEKFSQYSNNRYNSRYNNYLNHSNQDRSLFSDDEEKIKKDGFKTKEDSSWYSEGQNTSRIVLILGILFFLALAIVYLGISFSSSISNGLQYPDYPAITHEDDKLLFRIYEIVSEHEGQDCAAKDSKMILEELKQVLCQDFPETCTRSHIKEALKLQSKMLNFSNPADFPLKVLDANGQPVDVMSAVYITGPRRLSLWCRLLNSANKVAFYFLLSILVIAFILLVVKTIQYYKRKADEETKRVIDLVENIIHILKSHHDECMKMKDERDYVAISHVRDMLIPIQERKRLQPLWDKAVKFLSANESRVKVETQTIAGEVYAVWRWLHTSANGNKVWQGQAFGENRDLALNSPPASFLPCLKIRNMFDLDNECEDDWHIRIQDAILEKCGDDHGIVHIAVDKTSREGCVFVKCMSNEHSGKAYKALHGWWFNGSLVTVKYLRLERYHEHFPDAKYCNDPMQPSNNKCLSLSQPFHRSVMEYS